jgi:hypothetical protein
MLARRVAPVLASVWALAFVLLAGPTTPLPGSPLPADNASALYRVYEGVLQWHGSDPQPVVIVIESQTKTPGGMLVAFGMEHYRVASHWRSVRVRLNVDPRSLRVEIVEMPEPEDRAQETASGEPIVGTLAGDYRAIVNDVEGMPGSHPDFVLSARTDGGAAAFAGAAERAPPRLLPPPA